MYRFLLALVLCLSLGVPWEAIGQVDLSGAAVFMDRDTILAPPPAAAQPVATPGATIIINPPAGYIAAPARPAAAPVMPAAPVDEVPTPPPSAETESWWKPLIQNAHLWAGVITALVWLLKSLGVKKVDRYAKDFAEVVQISFLAVEEAGLLGEVPKGGKTGAFSDLFEGLMGERGHKNLSTNARGSALAEAKALNAAARKVPPAPSPTPAPSAPSR